MDEIEVEVSGSEVSEAPGDSVRVGVRARVRARSEVSEDPIDIVHTFKGHIRAWINQRFKSLVT